MNGVDVIGLIVRVLFFTITSTLAHKLRKQGCYSDLPPGGELFSHIQSGCPSLRHLNELSFFLKSW